MSFITPSVHTLFKRWCMGTTLVAGGPFCLDNFRLAASLHTLPIKNLIQGIFRVTQVGRLWQMHSSRRQMEVHEFSGTFQGQPAQFKMTSVIGHIYSLDFPKV